MARIRIGTSGWHYPSGAGKWNGVFYPAPRPKGFDELSFYAEFFDTVEVNATFYGMPRTEVCAGWAERTPKGFEFAVKLYQKFTHPTMYRERVEKELLKAVDGDELPDDAIAALIEANQSDFDAFKQGIEPLANGDRLGPLLAQFPASFRAAHDSRMHLASLLRAFHGHRVAVELRHKSWSDQADETRRLLDAFDAAWAWIDEPKFKDSVLQPTVEPASFAYLRLHGRNAKNWWHHANKDDRYDYLYTRDEMQPVAEQIEAVTRKNYRAYAYFNNHPAGKSIQNAATFKEMVGQDTKGLPAAVVHAATHRRD